MDQSELAVLIERTAAETRRHFDLVREDLKREIQLAGEGIAHLNEKLDREASDIRDEVKRGFVETQAMIKFSYAELDRRVTMLEAGFSRLEHLETRVREIESRR